MELDNSFSIRQLEPPDAARIARFMNSQPPKYLRFFYAFGNDETAIGEMLSVTRKDVYSGVFWREDLIGIFMLRGWDEGYDVPSFGVLIDDKYRGGNLGPMTLEIAKLISRLAGAKKLMTKMHPDNVTPRAARRFGLHQTGVEETTGNIIYHTDL